MFLPALRRTFSWMVNLTWASPTMRWTMRPLKMVLYYCVRLLKTCSFVHGVQVRKNVADGEEGQC